MHLFEPYSLRSVTLRNRVVVSPMCEYSATDGTPDDWHLVHLGSRAVGGAGAVITEACAVNASGRISPGDAGIYNDTHTAAWARIARFIHGQGAVPGIQLAHAGRKASSDLPWQGGKPLTPEQGGWSPIVAPSALAFDDGYAVPQALDVADIADIVKAFRSAAQRSLDAGFELIDCSSGGLVPHVNITLKPGYQIDFAARIRREADIATGAVGLITESTQAQRIIENGEADIVLLAREFLRDPYWTQRSAKALDRPLTPPPQYARAW